MVSAITGGRRGAVYFVRQRVQEQSGDELVRQGKGIKSIKKITLFDTHKPTKV
jgi:hypothetical protein